MSALIQRETLTMPRYRFSIPNSDRFDDEDGVILPDDLTARAYAVQIVNELRNSDEVGWTDYIIRVMRDGHIVWSIPFERASLWP
jgi:hypothetical protein